MALSVTLPAGKHLAGYADQFGSAYYLADNPPTAQETAANQRIADQKRAATTSAINDLLGLQATATEDQTRATAAQLTASGDQAEADAYLTATGLSTVSAGITEQAAGLKAYQEDRTVRQTVASQRADIAASGFGEGGTALSLLRDSVAQGHITTALTKMQGSIDAGGFLASAAATRGLGFAAEASAKSGQNLSAQYTASAALATARSTVLMSTLLEAAGARNLDELMNPPANANPIDAWNRARDWAQKTAAGWNTV